MINVNVDIDVEDLVYEIANTMDEEGIINMILDIDAQFADESFTKKLIEALKETLTEEE